MKQQHSIKAIFLLAYIVLSLLYIFADQWIGFKNAIIEGQYVRGRIETLDQIIEQANAGCQSFRVFTTETNEAYLVNTACLQAKTTQTQENSSSVSENNP